MQAFIPPTPVLGSRGRRRRPRCSVTLSASASPDVVVIGAGVAGLSTAYELAQKGASVQILASPNRRPTAYASAGMLAAEAENLDGDMHHLCHISRQMYPDFVRRLQRLVDIDVKYVARNDFLIPSMTPMNGANVFDEAALRTIEPALGPNVKAVRRSQGDASVDSRRLMSALHKACEALGVSIQEEEVKSIVVAPDAKSLQAVQTESRLVTCGHFLVASGAWTNKLFPDIPIRPVKGQMLSLIPPENHHATLNHVLYSHDVYVVPKNDGTEFYVGASVEDIGFDTRTTGGAINKLLSSAIELVPQFVDYEIKEMWSGLRPATPDLLPILGISEFSNVTLATGYYRNGILLAPAASQIAAAVALGEQDQLPKTLRHLTESFSYQRFLGATAEAQTRLTVDERKTIQTATIGNGREEGAKVKTPTPTETSHIKMYKVHANGRQEPVPPSRRFLEPSHGKANKSEDVPRVMPNLASVSSDVSSEEDPIEGLYQGGSGFEEHVSDPLNTSAENDAYEDVMRKRANADAVMSKALAANRAFGRNKSSLEEDGSIPLSISEEEVRAFDIALRQGLEDMQKLEKHFDPLDKGVLATRAEQERIHSDSARPQAVINGFSVPSMEEEGSASSESDLPSGYF